jgi:hypothetical protein
VRGLAQLASLWLHCLSGLEASARPRGSYCRVIRSSSAMVEDNASALFGRTFSAPAAVTLTYVRAGWQHRDRQ